MFYRFVMEWFIQIILFYIKVFIKVDIILLYDEKKEGMEVENYKVVNVNVFSMCFRVDVWFFFLIE